MAKYDKDTISSFLMASTANSYSSNNDGDGIYFNGVVIKSPNKINIAKYITQLGLSDCYISHQRLATHGKTNKYIQPFITTDFVFVHNGVMDSFTQSTQENDSTNVFNHFKKKFYRYMKKGSFSNREECIKQALQHTLKNADGSYSIALYDVQNKNLYYVKNESTNIYFYKSKDMLYITTSFYNDNYLTLIEGQHFKESDIEDFKVYRINIKNDDFKIKDIGDIEHKAVVYYSGYQSSSNTTETDTIKPLENEQDNINQYADYENNLKDIVDVYELHKCGVCNENNTTSYDSAKHVFICDNCLDKRIFPQYVN